MSSHEEYARYIARRKAATAVMKAMHIGAFFNVLGWKRTAAAAEFYQLIQTHGSMSCPLTQLYLRKYKT
jgi:hypothetical protein